MGRPRKNPLEVETETVEDPNDRYEGERPHANDPDYQDAGQAYVAEAEEHGQ